MEVPLNESQFDDLRENVNVNFPEGSTLNI